LAYITGVRMKKLTYEYVKNKIEEHGYKLISDKYISSKELIEVSCPRGHQYKVTYGNFYQGKRCMLCNIEKYRNSIEYVKSVLANENYTLLSEKYINNVSKILVQCNKNHPPYITTFNHFTNAKVRCPECSKQQRYSKEEKKVVDIIRKWLKNTIIIENDRSVIRNPISGYPLELDIWIPSMRKAIEFNGEYYHNDADTLYRDRIKKEYCNKQNIDLYIIWHNEWKNNQKGEMEKLRKFLGDQ